MPTLRIIIADGQPMFADGLRRLLEAEDGLTVVGIAHSAAAAARLAVELSPDVLLLDLTLPDGSALDVLDTLRALDTKALAILVTDTIKREQMVEAVELGARGLVLKHSPTALLVKCIRSVMTGDCWFGRDQVPDLVDALCQRGHHRTLTPAERLTRREIIVMTAVADGATNRDVATQLGLSEQTVKNHLSHIYDKVGVSNRVELTRFVMSHVANVQHSLPAAS